MTVLFVSTDAAFNRVSALISHYSKCRLLDMAKLDAMRLTSKTVDINGDIIDLTDLSGVFFYPDSTEQLLTGDEARPSMAEGGFLERRSQLALRIGLLYLIDDIWHRTGCHCNSPLGATLAANRIAFRYALAGRMPTSWIAGASLPINSGTNPRLLRFLPDTHVYVGERVTAPLVFDETIKKGLGSNTFPLMLENFIDFPFDVRVYVFGGEVLAYSWGRSPLTVDRRLLADAIDAERMDLAGNEPIYTDIEIIRERFNLEFFAVDYLYDGNDFVPVDLNVAPTWHWHGANSLRECNERFVKMWHLMS